MKKTMLQLHKEGFAKWEALTEKDRKTFIEQIETVRFAYEMTVSEAAEELSEKMKSIREKWGTYVVHAAMADEDVNTAFDCVQGISIAEIEEAVKADAKKR